MMIGVVAAVALGVTGAYFSDTEKSTGNTLTAGVVDIVVDDENPWTATGKFVLDDMKPSYTKYISFKVRNIVESNPINLWKHIHITDQSDGYITEPECIEGNGTWNGTTGICTSSDNCCTGNYSPRNNLAAYTLYDLYVCRPTSNNDCKTNSDGSPDMNTGWTGIITEDQYVRLDNVNSAWIYLGELGKGETMIVLQSYHLSSWPDAPEPEVTNWAQGDKMTFDIELMATQLNAPGPKGYQTTLILDNKEGTAYNPTPDDGIGATMTYKTSGDVFNYSLTGTVKNASTEYCLIYYADPFPGDGTDHSTGALIGKATSGSDKSISIANTTVELGTDLPNSKDQNYPAGAKVWLIPCNHYSTTTLGAQGKMTAWDPDEYLFEMQFITYDDTNN